jgi:hypothetical protein
MSAREIAAVTTAVVMLAGCGGSPAVSMPNVRITVDSTQVPTARGSYCWNSGGHGECADMASIEAVIKAGNLTPFRVPPDAVATLSFDRPPESIELSAGLDEAHLEAVTLSGPTFRTSAKPATLDYLLTARWKEGDISWVFLASVQAG